MTLTDEQRERIRAEVLPLAPQLKRAAPPERAKLVREALERAGARPTWDEWDACASGLPGDVAALVTSGALRR
jgi:hypothetical protein